MENENILEDLKKAKENVIWLINNPDGMADMHGLTYWAGVVEQLREKLSKL